MIAVLAAPAAVLALLMAVDEIFFHRRRELPRWERIGHPLDTLTVLCCYVVLLGFEPRGPAPGLYAVLAVFSCLFVTKDERVHQKLCLAAEHWLHAVLFMLHPLALASAALLWATPRLAELGMAFTPAELKLARTLLWGQAGATLAFGVYQGVYWNWGGWKSSGRQSHASH